MFEFPRFHFGQAFSILLQLTHTQAFFPAHSFFVPILVLQPTVYNTGNTLTELWENMLLDEAIGAMRITSVKPQRPNRNAETGCLEKRKDSEH